MADRHYFTTLFEQHHRALYAYAFRKTNDSFTAEEITQQVFIRYWQHISKKNIIPEAPQNLLFFIAKGLLVDHLRRKKMAVVPLEEAAATIDPVEHNTDFQYFVRCAVNTLTDRQRQIFELSYYHDLKHDEIAATLNISRQTVKNLLTKAMRQVRKLVSQQFLTLFSSML